MTMTRDKEGLRRRGRAVPWAFLLAVGGILLIEGLSAVWDDCFYTEETKTSRAAADGLDGLRIKIKNDFVREPGRHFSTLILGDSYMNSGVEPRLLESLTGRSTFNLAAYGDYGVFTAYCLLKNYLRRNPPPEILIMGFHFETLSRPRLEPAFLYEIGRGNLGALIGEIGLVQALKVLVPTLKHQGVLRRLITGEISPSRLLRPARARAFRERVIRDRGYYAPYADQMVIAAAGPENINPRYRFRLSESSRRNLIRILDLASRNGIRVLYVVPTHSWDWYRLYKEQGTLDAQDRALSVVFEGRPGVRWIRHQEEIQDLSLYADRLHLNLFGARRLTRLLARDLQAAFSH